MENRTIRKTETKNEVNMSRPFPRKPMIGDIVFYVEVGGDLLPAVITFVDRSNDHSKVNLTVFQRYGPPNSILGVPWSAEPRQTCWTFRDYLPEKALAEMEPPG